MREQTHPFLALICLRERNMMIVMRREGFIPANELITHLATAIGDNERHLQMAAQERFCGISGWGVGQREIMNSHIPEKIENVWKFQRGYININTSFINRWSSRLNI